MREATAYLFIGSILIMIAIAPFVFYKIEYFSKLNLSDDEYRFTPECKDKMEKERKIIDALTNKIKIIYLVFIFAVIDTSFKYTQTNSFFNSGIVTKIDDKNISMKLAICHIKDRRWWE